MKELFPNMSLEMVAQKFGGRDHATAIHAIKVVNDMNDTDVSFRNNFKEIMNRLRVKTRCNLTTTDELNK
jgi:chromosomal replication initiation ATPase DnaA